MNMLFIKHFLEGFMVSEIPRVSIFGHCPYSVTFSYISNLVCIYSLQKLLIRIIYKKYVDILY